MTRIVSAYIFASLLTPLASFTYAEEMPSEFRGIKWGAPILALGLDYAKIKYGPQVTGECYARPSDSLTLNDATLKSIEYCFVDNKFYSGCMTADENLKVSVLSSATAAFGIPKAINSLSTKWGNSKVPGRSTATLITLP